jgi:hypothetical protein
MKAISNDVVGLKNFFHQYKKGSSPAAFKYTH